MAACDASSEKNHSWPAEYTICVEGYLDPDWSEWLGGMVVVHTRTGNSLLTGQLVDAAALHGLLARILELNLLLLWLRRNQEQSLPW